MSINNHAHAVLIEISDASQLQERLTAAVNNLIHIAMESKWGILVTRHNDGSYTAAIDPSVPFGETQETGR